MASMLDKLKRDRELNPHTGTVLSPKDARDVIAALEFVKRLAETESPLPYSLDKEAKMLVCSWGAAPKKVG